MRARGAPSGRRASWRNGRPRSAGGGRRVRPKTAAARAEIYRQMDEMRGRRWPSAPRFSRRRAREAEAEVAAASSASSRLRRRSRAARSRRRSAGRRGGRADPRPPRVLSDSRRSSDHDRLQKMPIRRRSVCRVLTLSCARGCRGRSALAVLRARRTRSPRRAGRSPRAGAAAPTRTPRHAEPPRRRRHEHAVRDDDREDRQLRASSSACSSTSCAPLAAYLVVAQHANPPGPRDRGRDARGRDAQLAEIEPS